MHNEITIVDMMRMLAPQRSIRDLIYAAMDDMSRCMYTDDEMTKYECWREAWRKLDMAVDITYDKR
jgi:hypothetical protein